jgi:Co/Zn/Cd efflux system component/uncharacterized protein YdcH (DUF465 family)
MSGYHEHGCGCSGEVRFEGLDPRYMRVLWIVIALNAAMFLVEMGGGVLAGSQALQADALDFLGDTLTYGMSLAVIGRSMQVRATAAIVKGVSLALMGLWVFGSTIWQTFILGVPRAELMGLIGFLALAANATSVLLLLRYKDGDANVRSVWLCSRNDAIGNVAVMMAALGVWGTATGWPDVIVAAILALLFLQSATKILRQALAERRSARTGLGPSQLEQPHSQAEASACSASSEKFEPAQIVRRAPVRSTDQHRGPTTEGKGKRMLENRNTHNELDEMFPEAKAIIHELKMNDAHFAKLAERYHELNRSIHRMETNVEPVSDETMENERKLRLAVLDEIAEIIGRQAKASA